MRSFMIILLLVVLSSLSSAHDFFLYPSAFHIKQGDSVTIAIHVDDVYPGKFTKWNTQRIMRFEHWVGKDKLNLASVNPLKDSSGVRIKLERTGVHLFALDWTARLIELNSDDFKHYLESEGLDHVLQLRKERGEESKPGKERYSRYVKTFVNASSGVNEAFNQTVGQTIELIPLDNPCDRRVGDTLRVRLLFQGKPLVNALIASTYKGFTEKPDTYSQSSHTNQEGVVTIRLTHSGPWLIRTVHMLPLKDSKDADWESWWTSMTFDVRTE